MAEMDVIVGVDVGGTNTDAVVLSSDGQVKDKAKVLTSGVDLTGSVCQAVTKALNSVEGIKKYATPNYLWTTTSFYLHDITVSVLLYVIIYAPTNLHVVYF